MEKHLFSSINHILTFQCETVVNCICLFPKESSNLPYTHIYPFIDQTIRKVDLITTTRIVHARKKVTREPTNINHT